MHVAEPLSTADQRSAVRFQTAMPAAVAGEPGRTHDISASGVCIETEAARDVGSVVHLTLEYTQGGERRQLTCEGRVVRVEEKDGRVSLAASFLQPFFGDTEHVEAKAPERPRR